MNFLALSSLLNFVGCIGLASFVLLKGARRDMALAYGIFNLTLAFYSYYYALWQWAPTFDRALHDHQLLFLGVIWINEAYLYFIFTFLGMTPLRWVILGVAAGLNLFFSFLNFNGGLYSML